MGAVNIFRSSSPPAGGGRAFRDMYQVYALYNRKNDKIYVGQTEDLAKRLEAHKSGVFSKSYTARFDGSWDIVYTEPCPDRPTALKREKQLKSYQSRLFVRKLIPQ